MYDSGSTFGVAAHLAWQHIWRGTTFGAAACLERLGPAGAEVCGGKSHALLARVSSGAARAGADGLVAAVHVADGVPAADWACRRHTGVLALVLVAGFLGPTVVGDGTVALTAGQQRVTDVAARASADGTLLAGTVRAGRADRVGTARVGLTQVLIGEAPAALVRVASEAFGAGADGAVVPHVAVGAGAARVCAGVPALQLDAGLVRVTVVVAGALHGATDLRVTPEELRALAVDDVVADFAVSVVAAGPVGARVYAAQVLALLVAGAVAVVIALGAAAVQRVADVVAEARAHGALSIEGTFGVAATGRRVAVVAGGEAGAALVDGIATETSGARAHGGVVAGLALGVGTAVAVGRAGVGAARVLTDLVVSAVRVLDALELLAVGEGIRSAPVAVRAGAHSTVAVNPTVGVGRALAKFARVEVEGGGLCAQDR